MNFILKVLFIPFSIVGGILAGLVGKKVFDFAWGLIDDEEPPEPKQREVPWTKLAAALAVQGAIFRATRGAAERGSRTAFYRLTGSWPGEKKPDEA